MAEKIPTPSYGVDMSISNYEKEVAAWEIITKVAKDKRGIMLALNLEGELKNRVLENVSTDALHKETGVKDLLQYLKDTFGKDELTDSRECYKEFRDYKRKSGQSVNEYIAEFSSRVNRLQNKGVNINSEILAFELIERAVITSVEEKLVVTGLDFSKKEEMYDDAKTSLKKFLRETTRNSDDSECAIKIQPVNETTHDVEYNSVHQKKKENNTYQNNRGRNYQQEGLGNFNNSYQPNNENLRSHQNYQHGNFPASYRGRNYDRNYRDESYNLNYQSRRFNPRDRNGQVMVCHRCGSNRHFLRFCPKNENNFITVYGDEESNKTPSFNSENPVLMLDKNYKYKNRRFNPRDRNGQVMLCYRCGSNRHFIRCCLKKQNGFVTVYEGEESDKTLFFNRENPVLMPSQKNMTALSKEARGCAVIDTGCYSTVAGEDWFKDFINNHLTIEERNKIVKRKGKRLFRFGTGKTVKSIAEVVMPVCIAGMRISLVADIIKYDVPLLLSMASIKRADGVIFTNDSSISLFGKKICCLESRTGVWMMPLVKKIQVSDVCTVNMCEFGEGKLEKTISTKNLIREKAFNIKETGMEENEIVNIYKKNKCDFGQHTQEMQKSDILECKEHEDEVGNVEVYAAVIPKGKQNTPKSETAKAKELSKLKEEGEIEQLACDTISTSEEVTLQEETTPENKEIVREDSWADFVSVVLIFQLLLIAMIKRNLLACIFLEPILLQISINLMNGLM